MKSRKITLAIDLVLLIVLVILDQLTKKMAVERLMNKQPFVLIKGALELNYLENRGAAFGMLQNKQWVFIIIGLVFLIAAIVLLGTKIPVTGRFTPLRIAILLIASGAVGNIIDRISLNYVVDFIYFSLIDFPVFNVADIFVTCGTALMIILILFVYKDNELEFMGNNQEKSE